MNGQTELAIVQAAVVSLQLRLLLLMMWLADADSIVGACHGSARMDPTLNFLVHWQTILSTFG